MKKLVVALLLAAGFGVLLANNAFAAGLNANVALGGSTISVEFDKAIKIKNEDLSVAAGKADKVQFLLDFFAFEKETDPSFAATLKNSIDQDKIHIEAEANNKQLSITVYDDAIKEAAFKALDDNKDGIFRMMFKLDPAAISTTDGSTLDAQGKEKEYRLQFKATGQNPDGTFNYAKSVTEFLTRADFDALPPVAPKPSVPAVPAPSAPAAQPKKDNKTKISAPNTGVKAENYAFAAVSVLGLLGVATYFVIKKK